MPQAVKLAGKVWLPSLPLQPHPQLQLLHIGVKAQISAQRIQPCCVVVDLPVTHRAGHAVGRDACDHVELLGHPGAALSDGEVAAFGQVDPAGVVQVVVAARAIGRGLAELQRKLGVAAAQQIAVDVNVGLRTQCEAVAAPAHFVSHVEIAQAGLQALGAVQRHVVVRQRGAQSGAADVAAAGGHGEIGWVDQPGAGLATAAARGHAGGFVHLHHRCAGLDETAIAAFGRGGVQRARDLGAPHAQITQQHNAALAGLHRAGLDDTRVVHDRGGQRVQRFRFDQHSTTISRDAPSLLNKGIERAPLDAVAQQAAALQLQRDMLTRSQHGAAQARGDVAGLLHLRCGQHHIAALGCRDASCVTHTSCGATALQLQASGGEVCV